MKAKSVRAETLGRSVDHTLLSPEGWTGRIDHTLLSPEGWAGRIDHTLLSPEATEAQIRRHCAEAERFQFATVCVHPTWVELAAHLLAGSRVGVCSVVGFPLGASTPHVKVLEARLGLRDGASEIDMVLNLGRLRSGQHRMVADEIRLVTSAVHDGGGLVKVILETAVLNRAQKVAACLMARQAGADFVKTSTGFGPGGATVRDVALLRSSVGKDMGVKAAGGIRDLSTARGMIAAGASRIGTSAGVRIVREAASKG